MSTMQQTREMTPEEHMELTRANLSMALRNPPPYAESWPTLLDQVRDLVLTAKTAPEPRLNDAQMSTLAQIYVKTRAAFVNVDPRAEGIHKGTLRALQRRGLLHFDEYASLAWLTPRGAEMAAL